MINADADVKAFGSLGRLTDFNVFMEAVKSDEKLVDPGPDESSHQRTDDWNPEVEVVVAK